MSICPDCNRNAPNMEHCERCNPQEYPTHCPTHGDAYGEGDICGQCEAEFDNYRAALNAEMLKHEYQLWFLCSKQYWFKCPVADFDSAKMLYHSLNAGSVTGVRIARYDPEQGCESVLHKFS